VHYIKKSDIKKEINIRWNLRCSQAKVQIDRAINFPSQSKRVGNCSQKLARCCRVEGPPKEGDPLVFVYFLVLRSISLCWERYFS